ncbi:MAG: FimB/Mfa2 family fimbrial subunit [Rikenellaceae bacterium]
MVKKLVLNISLFLLVIQVFVSCNIKEDMSDCPGSIILDYSAYSDVILDEIESQTEVDIFVFDNDSICVEIYTFTYGDLEAMGFEFSVPIEYRGYNATVWQGLESSNYTSRRMVLGENYNNFYMRLVHNSESNSYTSVPDPIWASPLEPIDYCAKITRHRIYMTRLHTKVELNIQQKLSDNTLMDLDMEDYLVTIEAHNNVYHTDYTIDVEESVDLEYNNMTELDSGKDLVCARVGTLRTAPDMDCTLYIEPKTSEDSRIVIQGASELDLIEYMLATKGDSSLSDQEFLDLNKIWQINVIVQEQQEPQSDENIYIALGISINGWVIWFTSSELS